MTKVSIIVPVYNVEKYLAKCLDSLINQTLKEIEIICINDGSRDNSLSILREYSNKDNRIIVVDKKNEGQSIARNIGISRASGEYLGFVDSDDWVDLDYFEKLYNSAKKYDTDISCAGYKRVKKCKSRVRKSFEAELLCKTTNDKVRLDNVPADNYIWNKIYKRNVWLDKKIKFVSGRYFEDIALVIKILHQFGDMIIVPDTYYNYRVNSNSTVMQKTFKHTRDYNWAINELYEYAEKNSINININNIIKKKEYYKLFNITLMKIYYYENLVKYNLLGFIPFIRKIIA